MDFLALFLSSMWECKHRGSAAFCVLIFHSNVANEVIKHSELTDDGENDDDDDAKLHHSSIIASKINFPIYYFLG